MQRKKGGRKEGGEEPAVRKLAASVSSYTTLQTYLMQCISIKLPLARTRLRSWGDVKLHTTLSCTLVALTRLTTYECCICFQRWVLCGTLATAVIYKQQ